MYKGSLVAIEDLSNEQIENILDLAQEIDEDLGAFYGLGTGRIIANLFMEPSTRTRGSFQVAMKRLGGDSVTVADPESSSIAKGETLADTIRIWSSYTDLIVLRHPWEGAARLAAEYSDVPIINAGDGSHEHPTQTLLDLYTLRKELGALEGRKIVLSGDLKNGRTIHSLTYALLRFGAVIITAPGQGLETPDYVKHRLLNEFGAYIEKVKHPGLQAMYGNGIDATGEDVDAIYITPPSKPHTPSYWDSGDFKVDQTESIAIYVTRRQTERSEKSPTKATYKYPRVDAKLLKRRDFSKAVILHPLPRVDELSTDIDTDSRSRYFEQARNGVPVRMALIAYMLGLKPWRHEPKPGRQEAHDSVTVTKPRSIVCRNPNCVTGIEPQSTVPVFKFHRRPFTRFVCEYCERETIPSLFSYPWGEVYRPIQGLPKQADPSEFGFYVDEGDAVDGGLRPLSGSLPGTIKRKSEGSVIG